jgi:hypothetical protein
MPVPTPFPDPGDALALSFGTAANVSVDVLPQPTLPRVPASREPPSGPELPANPELPLDPVPMFPPESPLGPEPLLAPGPPLDPELELAIEPLSALPEPDALPLLAPFEPPSAVESLECSPQATAIKARHIANGANGAGDQAAGLFIQCLQCRGLAKSVIRASEMRPVDEIFGSEGRLYRVPGSLTGGRRTDAGRYAADRGDEALARAAPLPLRR